MPLVRLTDRPLGVEEHVAAVADPRSGAVATFLGRVRDHDPGVTGEVVALEYSAHPDAERVLERIAAHWAAHDGVLGVAVSHRVGRLAVGEAASVAAVESPRNARCPDSISYRIAPKEKMSDRASTLLPSACSGDM